MDNAQPIIDITRRWIASVVIGLNLCPFARRVFEGERIRYAVSQASTETALTKDLRAELRLLTQTPIDEIETTLLILPFVLADFLDFNDYLDTAEHELHRLGLEGTIQIASFHPGYQFAGTSLDDVENYTNRSPYAMLHLLREASITALAVDDAELAAIPERNIATMRRLGRHNAEQLLREACAGRPGLLDP
jgi:hypothetical protein